MVRVIEARLPATSGADANHEKSKVKFGVCLIPGRVPKQKQTFIPLTQLERN